MKEQINETMELVNTLDETRTKFTDKFSQEIFDVTYAYGKESIDDCHSRVARDLASVEKEELRDEWTKNFEWLLKDFKFVPGGRILSNAGTGLKGTSYINCFVSGFQGENQDSMLSILDELRRQAMILKSEGGYGINIDVLRPRGGFIEGIGNESPGAVKMLDMWDTQSAVITSGSGRKSNKSKAKIKIRKGAQMVTMSCWHPDIEEYITAKQTPGKLTKFNMSVLITDELMEAVKTNSKWDLEFPDLDWNKEIYNKEWQGDLKEWKSKGYPVVVYKTFANANELWDVIMTSTYNRNEPGVLFIDTINKLNNLYYCEKIRATNPCFTKDTIVSTPNGDFTVEEILANKELYKEIYSYNTITKEVEVDTITDVFLTKENANIIELELEDGGKIKLTPDHRVFTENRGWVEAAQLTIDDVLIKIS